VSGEPACSLAALDAAGGLLAVERAGREAIVVRAGSGEVFALERYCPHEGYPLDDADVRGDTLTCPWHGWCFDLRSGACLTAGEDARAYAVEVRGGDVYVALDVEASAAERGRLTEVLLSAVEAGDGARAARNVVRLLDAGAEAESIAGVLVRYGATHGVALTPATAVVADVLELARLDPASAPLLLAEAAVIVAEREGRRPPRLPAEPASPFAYGGEAGAAAALAAAIAQRTPEVAESIALALLERETDPLVLAGWLAAAGCARFLGAWPLALVERAARLAALGRDTARYVLPAAARALALAPPLDGAAPYAGRSLAPAQPGDLARSLGESLARLDLALERDDGSDASLLGVAEGLVVLHAAARSGVPVELSNELLFDLVFADGG
jgi:nitrite reductase/ring-hydroxylating ferredoxin subunit